MYVKFKSPRRRIFIIIGLLILFIPAAILAGFLFFNNQDNDVVVTKTEDEIHAQAIVSAHEIATEAGFKALEEGGTAADAAVAVAAALSVVEPWFSSALGGGTWALYYDSETGEVTSLDGVGPVGGDASAEDYRMRASDAGMHQAIVPGAWDGWMLWLDEYGNLELDEVLMPSIEAAREGYEVSPEMAEWLSNQAAEISARPDTFEIYTENGNLVSEGDIVFQHDLADTFEELIEAYNETREEGRNEAIQSARDYFYRGPVAERIVQFSQENNGYLTIEDFHGFEAQITKPVSIEYSDDITVFQNPPNSQGITMLIGLNILKGYDYTDLNSQDANTIHRQAEAFKLAFADRYYHVGDPDRVNVPVEELLSEEHADAQRRLIDLDNAMEWPISDVLNELTQANPDYAHTTTFQIVDAEGNAASVTTSLGAEFLVVGDTGIHINNRMRMLSLDEGNPNQMIPGYKVRHTSSPYMSLRNNTPYVLGGNTGVDTQPQAQIQQFMHVVEFGLSAQEAIEHPRFVSTAFPSSMFPYRVENTLQMENGFPSGVVGELTSRGHNTSIGEGIYGNAGMIILNEDGMEAEVGVEYRNDTSNGRIILPE